MMYRAHDGEWTHECKAWTAIVTESANILAALLVGLLGGVHCIGMCGGIVAALSVGLRPRTGAGSRGTWGVLLGYNLGRISSYGMAGALAGWLGEAVLRLGGLEQAQRWLQLVAALFILALGAYLGGWWSGLRRLEAAGGWLLWRHIAPLGRRWLPVRNPLQAYATGLVWGWLPCGLVYSVLIWSLASGSALRGAGLMLGFGLGTLPNLLLLGALSEQLRQRLQRPRLRRLVGALLLGYGLFLLYQAGTRLPLFAGLRLSW